MNLDEIKQVIHLMDENRLVEFEYEDEGRRIKLRRAEERAAAPALPIAVPAPAGVPVQPAGPASDAAAPAPGAGRGPNIVEFKSPLVGTFYRAPRPDAEPFVNVGDEVNPEKVLCVIEAMKVMNEIKAEMGGIVREVLAKNSQAVEYGELLFLIERK